MITIHDVKETTEIVTFPPKVLLSLSNTNGSKYYVTLIHYLYGWPVKTLSSILGPVK